MNKLNMSLISLISITTITGLTSIPILQAQSTPEFLESLGWTVNEFDSSLKTICEQSPGATNTSFVFRTSYTIDECLPLMKEIVPDQPMNIQTNEIGNDQGYIFFITLLSDEEANELTKNGLMDN